MQNSSSKAKLAGQSVDEVEEEKKNEEDKLDPNIVFPPTFKYLPTNKLMRYMINQALKAKKDENGDYGFLFWEQTPTTKLITITTL